MAEEVNQLVTPQKNTLEGKKLVDESIAKTNHPIGNGSATHPRRVSLGSPGKLHIPTPNYKQDVSPRYLRASIASCHDLCKYGRRVTDEPKPWRSVPKRNGKPPVDVLVSKKPPVSVERKRVVSMKHMNESNAHSGGLNVSPDNVTVSGEQPKIIKRDVLSSPKKVELPSNGLETDNLMLGTVMQSSAKSTNNFSVVQPKLISMQSTPSDASERKLRKSTRNGDAKNVKSLMKSKSLSSVDASKGKLLSRRNSIINCNKTSEACKSSLKNVIAHSNNKLSPSSIYITGNVDVDRTRKSVQNASGTKSKHENLHVSKMVTGRNLAESSLNRQDSAPLPDLVIISPKSLSGPLSSQGCNRVEEEKIDVEEKGDDDAGASLTINKTTMKQNGNEIEKANLSRKSSQDNDSSLRKLQFSKGRTIELQSDNNAPRKLKFKSGKVRPVKEDGQADIMKNLKKKTISNKLGVNQRSRKVVLRHRGMEDKKDAQGLFNNVIEETASKLVQSRNSKVKALVGAFETVISLQDSNPAS